MRTLIAGLLMLGGLVFGGLAAAVLGVGPAYAFKPAAHSVIMMEAVKRLPAGSALRNIIETHPAESYYWGANAPDLGFLDISSVLNPPNWGTRYHSESPDEFAAEQLRLAVESRDPARIAFAAGWIAHLKGDEAGHGTYVDPEANTFPTTFEQLLRHGELELWAEPYVWIDLGGRSAAELSASVFPGFFEPSPSAEIRAGIRRASLRIYSKAPLDEDVESWSGLYQMGLSEGLGYEYIDHDVAMAALQQQDRLERLNRAFAEGVDKVESALRAIQIDPPVDERPSPFPDLESTHPYYSALVDLHERGALQGYLDGRLQPQNPVTRQQFAKMLVRALEIPVSEADVCPFTDVEPTGPGLLYPDHYVGAAYLAGLMKGRTSATFDPGGKITCAALVTVAVRAAATRYVLWDEHLPADWESAFAGFSDATHGENLRQAEFNDLLREIDLQGWDPWAPATRAEAAQVLHNALSE